MFLFNPINISQNICFDIEMNKKKLFSSTNIYSQSKQIYFLR